jgi:lambda repressor-like predicted transcriptional regulator
MDFRAILARIEAKIAEQGTTARAVSLQAGLSSDGIRNWQRALRSTGTISGMNARSIASVAAALNVTTEWLMAGGSTEAAPPLLEFREPDVIPLRPDLQQKPSQLLLAAADLAPRARHIQYFICRSDFPGFAILRGDLIVIGTPARTIDGDLVVATLADLETGTSTTVLRQRMGDRLVPPVSGRMPGEDHLSTGILGTVVAVLRGGGIADMAS